MGWQERIERDEIVLIDGGTGSELQRRGVPMSEANWSGLAVKTHPDILREVHQAYIAAGAEVIITNTFGTARFQLAAAGIGDEFEAVNRQAVSLAMEAREASGVRVEIAGSMSNLPPRFDPGAYPDPDAELADLREMAHLLADSGVDLIALEMMQDTHHAPRAMQAALEVGLPVWLGVSCRTVPGASGLVSFDLPSLDFAEPIDTLLGMGPSLVTVMHSEIPAVLPALAMIRERWDGPVGAYPEVGYFTSPNWHFDPEATPEKLVAHAREWVGAGARVIGGCCGTTPEHIAALRDAELR